MYENIDYVCDGQMTIFDFIPTSDKKNDTCPHKEKCYNHPAGCKGLSYWCKRYDKEGEK